MIIPVAGTERVVPFLIPTDSWGNELTGVDDPVFVFLTPLRYTTLRVDDAKTPPAPFHVFLVYVFDDVTRPLVVL